MLNLLAQAAAALAARAIPHALIGAGALTVHGISRATFDGDLRACTETRRPLPITAGRCPSVPGEGSGREQRPSAGVAITAR